MHKMHIYSYKYSSLCYSSLTIMEALLGNLISTPEHSILEDKWSEILKPSEL